MNGWSEKKVQSSCRTTQGSLGQMNQCKEMEIFGLVFVGVDLIFETVGR